MALSLPPESIEMAEAGYLVIVWIFRIWLIGAGTLTLVFSIWNLIFGKHFRQPPTPELRAELLSLIVLFHLWPLTPFLLEHWRALWRRIR